MSGHPFKASACWVDVDNDGLLDLFVTRYFQWTQPAALLEAAKGLTPLSQVTLQERMCSNKFANSSPLEPKRSAQELV